MGWAKPGSPQAGVGQAERARLPKGRSGSQGQQPHTCAMEPGSKKLAPAHTRSAMAADQLGQGEAAELRAILQFVARGGWAVGSGQQRLQPDSSRHGSLQALGDSLGNGLTVLGFRA